MMIAIISTNLRDDHSRVVLVNRETPTGEVILACIRSERGPQFPTDDLIQTLEDLGAVEGDSLATLEDSEMKIGWHFECTDEQAVLVKMFLQ